MSRLIARIAGAAAIALFGLAAPGPAQEPHRFTVVVPNLPDSLDLQQVANTPSVTPTMANVVEMLVGLNHDGSIKPGLAESWTISPDGKTIDFHLRHGVKFQSGDELTAADVLWSHERMMQKVVLYRASTMHYLDHVEAPDLFTVRFVFTRPDASFLLNRAGVYVESKTYFDRVGEQAFAAHPIGTGPYKVAAVMPGQYIDLDAWDGYWGPKPAVGQARIVWRPDDATRVAMLKSGEADMAMNVPYPDVGALKTAGYAVFTSDNHPTESIQFQLWNPDTPWAKLEVRQAIAHAIDYDAIITGLLHGIPHHFARLAPGESGYDPTLKPYGYDPALARKELAEAGYPGGFKMPLTYWVGNYTAMRETTEAVALYLRAVGIDVQISSFDPPHMMSMLRTSGRDPKAEVVLMSPLPMANFSDPLNALTLAWLSSSPGSLYPNKDLDALIEKASMTLDDQARGEIVRQAMKLINDQYASIGIWNAVTVYAAKAGWKFDPTNRNAAQMFLADVTPVG